jgi:hypothetical protein
MNTRKGVKSERSITLVNIDELKDPRTGHLIIHFDGKQWKKATSKFKRANLVLGKDKLPARSVAFVPVAPNRPDEDVFVLADRCGNGCVKQTWPEEDGLGRCDCSPKIPMPSAGDQGAPQNLRGCSVVLRQGSFRCIGIGCGSNCRPELRFIKSGSRVLVGYVVCVCS